MKAKPLTRAEKARLFSLYWRRVEAAGFVSFYQTARHAFYAGWRSRARLAKERAKGKK